MQKRLFTEINEKAKILELLGNHFRPKNVGEDVAPPFLWIDACAKYKNTVIVYENWHEW